ncbi:septum formation family protein [Schaalia sp. 19OD2882]|uniref:septum formation family protein n=1 Tax=Schaalia sp. 19OD2882 TaxID=2794089 RepID=UPI001C1EE4C8|nr:septum formation family protein [Schaalia sp. 19OD2882]QWW19390.1 septum formation family protein [Schaalia sp. 19OD2882]
MEESMRCGALVGDEGARAGRALLPRRRPGPVMGVVAACCLALPLVLSGCGITPALALKVGDCFSQPENAAALTLEGRSCEAAHDGEVFAVIELDQPAPADLAPSGPVGTDPADSPASQSRVDGAQSVPLIPDGAAHPGGAVLDTLATRLCDAAFEPYVGTAPEDSTMDVAWFKPSKNSWLRGDRSITCFVHSADGSQLVGSVRGSAQ